MDTNKNNLFKLLDLKVIISYYNPLAHYVSITEAPSFAVSIIIYSSTRCSARQNAYCSRTISWLSVVVMVVFLMDIKTLCKKGKVVARSSMTRGKSCGWKEEKSN